MSRAAMLRCRLRYRRADRGNCQVGESLPPTRTPDRAPVRLYRPDGSNVDLVRRYAIEQGARIAVPGSSGPQIAPELSPKVVELDHELLLSGRLQQVGTVKAAATLGSSRAAISELSQDLDLRSLRTRFPHRAGVRRDVACVASGATGDVRTCRAIGVAVRDVSETLGWLGG
jgi:hypothetical protein